MMLIMIRWFAALLAFAAVFSGCTGPPGGGSPEVYVRVSPRDTRYFELSDGSPYIPVGLNIAFPRFDVEEEPVLRKLDEQMRKLSENGGNFVRIWIGHPFYDVEHDYSGKYDSLKVRRIDRVVDLARRYNIRLKLTLEHFRTLEEQPPRFPGSVSMGKPVHHVSRGGPAKNMTEFFTLEKSRRKFKGKIAWFAKRYRDEPAVMAWELWNEINAVEGEGWREWTEEMLAELHAQLPNHLAVQSVGSLDIFRKRFLYEPVWRMHGNDFAQVHRYLDEAADLEVCRGPVDVMAADAIRTVARLDVGKPVILAGSGAVEPAHAGPSRLYDEDREGTILHDVVFAPFFAGSAGSGQSWHWHFYVDRHDLWYHFGRFAQVVRGLDPPAESFQPGELDHERLRIYTLRGRKTFLAWCRDREADWKTELVEKRRPKVARATVDLNRLEGGAPAGTWRVYDPWKDVWTVADVSDGVIRLPDFARSIVIRVDL